MTSAVIYSFCKPELVGFLSLMVVLETLIIIIQQIILHSRGVKPK